MFINFNIIGGETQKSKAGTSQEDEISVVPEFQSQAETAITNNDDIDIGILKGFIFTKSITINCPLILIINTFFYHEGIQM